MKFNYRLFPALFRAIIFSFLSYGSLNVAFASHGMGADLTYTCIGPNEYLVTLTFFRDCSGIAPDENQTLIYSSPTCGVNNTVPMPKSSFVVDVTPICPTEVSNCAGGSSFYGTEQHTYETVINLPPGCGNDWQLRWEQCCRNFEITTLTEPQNMDLVVTANLDNTIAPCNNSPIFNNIPTPIVCSGEEVFYNHGVTDQDGDSLVFSLVDCSTTSDQNIIPVTYNATFSATSPLATAAGVDLNTVTGEMRFTPIGAQIGVICILVEEYRNGVKIGETVRDMQFSVVNCSNNSPFSSGIDNGTDYTVSICNGTNICFDIFQTDVNGDNIEVSWNNGIPDAIFTINNNNTPAPSARFCWATDQDDVGTHFFTVTVADNACLLRGSRIYTYTIEVFETSNVLDAGDDQILCEGESTALAATSTGALSYTWEPTTGLSNPNIANPIVTPTATTVYTVTADFLDGCTISDYVTVNISEPPVVNASPTSAYVCPGSSTTLNANAPTAIGYLWSTGETTPSISVNPATTESFWVSIVDANGCTNSDTATVRVNEPDSNGCVVVYATPAGTGDGTQADPASLVDAITLATCNDMIVKLDVGTYAIDNPITNISGGVTIEGGFDAANNWTKTSMAGASRILRSTANIEPNPNRLVAIYISDAVNFRFQDVTIEVADASAATPGTSTYGVHLTNCSDYEFVRCQIIAGNAAAGAPGAIGEVGADGGNGVNGGNGNFDNQDLAGDGGNGGDGGGLNPGTGGLGGVDTNDGSSTTGGGCCYSPFGNKSCCEDGNAGDLGGQALDLRSGGGGGGGASGGEGPGDGAIGGGGGANFGGTSQCCGGPGGNSGNPGGNGGDGDDGADGAVGGVGMVGAGLHNNGFWQPGTGTNGEDGTGGKGGTGGGSGGGQDGFVPINGAGNGGGGGGGGGQGGGGGEGGEGGGSAYAIYLYQNGINSVFDDCLATTGTAGAGGAGGAGGQGGDGGIGGFGGIAGSFDVGTGGDGGDGGDGGNGGNGGDGSSGEAMAIFIDGNAPNINETNFDLLSQPEILMENISCVNQDLDFSTTIAGNWDFSADATPQTANNTTLATTQYGTIGRKNVDYNGNIYTGFANVVLADNPIPEGAASAQLVNNEYHVCAGETVDFDALNGGFGYIYSWDLGGGSSPNTFSGTDAQSLTAIPFNTPGTYTIQLQYQTDCCGLSPIDTLTLVVEEQPVAAIVGDTAFCAGTDGVVLAGSGGSSYTWAPAVGLSNSVGDTIIAAPDTNRTYTMTAFNASGLCSDVAQANIVVNDFDLLANTADASCGPDGAAMVMATGGSGFYSYEWNTSPPQLTDEALNLESGAYEVTVTDDNTGCIESLAIFVGATPANLLVGVSELVPASCPGDDDGSARLSVQGGAGPYTFTWKDGISNTEFINNVPAGVYTYTITDQATLCTVTDSLEIPEPSPVGISVLAIDSSTCNNFGRVEVNAFGGNGPFTFAWSDTTLGTTNIADSLLPDTTYTLIVTDEKGCADTLNVVAPGPESPVSLAVVEEIPPTFCGLTDGRVAVQPSGGDGNYTYTWDHDPLAVDSNLVDLPEGAYLVTVEDGNGCTAVANLDLTNCPLPIELLSFDAEPKETYIQLDWTTTNEQNNFGFQVERSTDSTNFESIGWKDALGGSGGTYQLNDEGVKFDTRYYYRLKQMDLNGAFHYSDIRSAIIQTNDLIKLIGVYPVPTKDIVNIDLQIPADAQINIQLSNTLGQAISHQTFDGKAGLNQLSIDLKSMASGVYYAKVRLASGYERDVKVVKRE